MRSVSFSRAALDIEGRRSENICEKRQSCKYYIRATRLLSKSPREREAAWETFFRALQRGASSERDRTVSREFWQDFRCPMILIIEFEFTESFRIYEI